MASTMRQIFEAVKSSASAYNTAIDTSSPKEARRAFDELGSSIRKVVGAIPVVGQVALTVFDGIRAAITTVASAAVSGTGVVLAFAGAITSLMTGPLTSVQQFVASIAPFVNLANPGVMMQFTLAMQNSMAVIGGLLTPVVQGATIWMRHFGDSIARLTPVIQPLFNAIGQAMANIAAGMGPVLEAMAPDIELITDLLEDLVNWFGRGIALWQGMVIQVIDTINQIFGLTSKRYNKDASSQDAAVRGVNVSSVEQFAQDVFKRSAQGAFGYGQGKKPEEFLPEIAAKIEEGKEMVRELVTVAKQVWEWVKNRKNEAVEGVNKADNTAKTLSPAYAAGSWLLKKA